MKAMKILDRAAILLLNLFLLLVSITIPAISVAATPAFYEKQFEKTGIYATLDENGEETRAYIHYIGGKARQTARFSDEQIDVIIHHIVDYLFTDQESFELKMDGVELNGKTQDGVEIFGEIAVEHMIEVKDLFEFVIVLTTIMLALLVGLTVYLICRFKHVAPLLLKYTLIFYAIVFTLAGAFLGWVAIDAKKTGYDFTMQLWRNFHHILFPFQADKFAGSFFNDTLTSVLTLDFFLAAIVTVLIVMGVTLTAWFGIAIFGKVQSKRKFKKI